MMGDRKRTKIKRTPKNIISRWCVRVLCGIRIRRTQTSSVSGVTRTIVKTKRKIILPEHYKNILSRFFPDIFMDPFNNCCFSDCGDLRPPHYANNNQNRLRFYDSCRVQYMCTVVLCGVCRFSWTYTVVTAMTE